MKIYSYKNCGTCKKALKYLQEKSIDANVLAIRETPPSVDELKFMLDQYDGNIKKLFNTSGQDYRAMGIKVKIDSMSTEEAFKLLSENGNLVKRPFVISGSKGLVGFKEDEWDGLTT